MTDFWAVTQISMESCSEGKQREEADKLIRSLGKQAEGVNNTRTCKRQGCALGCTQHRGREPLLGSRQGGKAHAWRRGDGGDGEVGIVELFTLTDSLMTRWCWVCQQSCRLRMNGCLTCRCEKRTHARKRTNAQAQTLIMSEERRTSNLVPCYRMRVSKGCCHTRTVHTNFTLPLSLLVVLHAYYFLNCMKLHNASSGLISMFSTDFGITFDLQKLVFLRCISIIERLTVVRCHTWMMTSSLSCSTASCFTTFNFGRTWKQQWNTWTQSFLKLKKYTFLALLTTNLNSKDLVEIVLHLHNGSIWPFSNEAEDLRAQEWSDPSVSDTPASKVLT